MRQITLEVAGMKCDGCAAAVREALSAVAGVESVEVRLEEGQARLAVSDDTTAADLVQAVATAGYQAALRPA